MTANWPIETGRPLPLGVCRDGSWTHFAIVSEHPVTLVIYHCRQPSPAFELALDPVRHRTGTVWHVALQGLPDAFEYGYRLAPETLSASTPHVLKNPALLLDPYARAISGAKVWGQLPQWPMYPAPWDRVRPRRYLVAPQAYDWGAAQPPHTPLGTRKK